MELVEMTIESIRVALYNYQRVLLLKEKNSERYLPIWVAPAEAEAIAVKLQGISVPRPLTHDLFLQLLELWGAKLESIIICDFKDEIFYAKLVVGIDGGLKEIDCRPSDAVALAVRVGAPILVDREILDKTAVDTRPI